VILLDLELPDGSGLETLRRIAPFAEEASVVVITGSQDERLGVEALKVGAIDYLIKGQIDGRQLRRILHYAVERHHMQMELHSLALQDDLTGLHNRRGFLLLAEQQMKISRRNHSSCLLLFLDIDGLKRIMTPWGMRRGTARLSRRRRCCARLFDSVTSWRDLAGTNLRCLPWERGSPAKPPCGPTSNRNSNKSTRDPIVRTLFVQHRHRAVRANARCSFEDLLAKSDALMYQDKKHKTLSARLSAPGA